MLPNISRSKDNQTMNFGQLRDYNIAFLKHHTQIVVEKLFLDPFLKESRSSISLDQ